MAFGPSSAALPIVLASPGRSHPVSPAAHSHTYGNVLSKAPVFADCSGDFVNALAATVNLRIYAPGDKIVNFGEAGDEMFFLNRVRCVAKVSSCPIRSLFAGRLPLDRVTLPFGRRRRTQGEVEVILANGQVIAHLGEGDLFGEIAFYSGGKRTANVVAKTWCDAAPGDSDFGR